MNVKMKVVACGVTSSTLLSLNSNAVQANPYHTPASKTPASPSVEAYSLDQIKDQIKSSTVEPFTREPLIDKRLIEPVFLTETISEAADIETIDAVFVDANFENDSSSSKTNQVIDTTIWFLPRSGSSHTPFVRIGANTFQQNGVEEIVNFPLQIGIEKQFKTVSLSAGGGGDFFNRLPTTPSLFAKVAWQATPSLSFFGDATYKSYKFSAASLENDIRAIRATSAVFWELDSATNLYGSFTWGDYSDGNQEQQLFASVQRKFGNFFLNASAFFWNYSQDLDNGYFDPDSYSLYEGEFGWEGRVTDALGCLLSASVGTQRLDQNSSTANSYKGKCTAQLSPRLEAGLGYYYSNIIDSPFEESAQRSTVSGHVRFSF